MATDAAVPSRTKTLAALSDTSFDLVVVGGGIIGAAVARDAALRGLSVALVEKDDFASGTSSKSTKLVHGGLRYLEQGELGLVFESVNERKRLMKLARHLVRPLAFMVVNYRGDRRWLTTLNLGLWLYEALCFFDVHQVHRTYRTKGALAIEPMLKPQGLAGGIVYYDAMTDDARITLENALDARALGAFVANHVKATTLLKEGERVIGLSAQDTLTGSRFDVKGRVVINATGPWTDELRALAGEAPVLKPTKGVHVVVDAKRLPLNHALVLTHPTDKRVVFAIPWGWGRSVIGTTDTFHEGSADGLGPDPADIDYLLGVANAYVPDAKLTPDDVLATWTGLRPLLAPAKATSGASQVSREHLIYERAGLLTIAGGKLTTYRRMAMEVVDRALGQLGKKLPCTTLTRPLPGSVGLEESDAALDLVRTQLEGAHGPALARLVTETYGARGGGVLSRPGATDRLDAELPHVMSQVDEAVQHEFACTLDDVLTRRLSLILRARDQGQGVAPKVAERMATLLGWTAEETSRQLAHYRAQVELSRRFRR